MRCYYVQKNEAGNVISAVQDAPVGEVNDGELLVRVRYSSLNYKDAMAAAGNPGVAKRLPHVPGIDAVGVVEQSDSSEFPPGAEVIVTGHDLGAGAWGGWAEYVRVPADWAVSLPETLSPLEAMTLGTAGFTAAQCVRSLRHHEVTPKSGAVAVTGATGGVGSLAVMILAKLGYEVVAVTGKSERHDWLCSLGAAEVISREALQDDSNRPLLPARFAGAVDTVGGKTLAVLLRSLKHRGCAAACGLVGGVELPLTVYPFLLRGVTLDGIDSAWCPKEPRLEIWNRLSGAWKPDGLAGLATVVQLDDLQPQIDAILAGQIAGRVVVDLN